MSAILVERLSAVVVAAAAAPHGQRGAIYRAACAELGISLQTLHRKLHEISVRTARKRRRDAGSTGLTLVEAKIISAYYLEHIRKNEKRTKAMARAIEELRTNGMIVAGNVDPETGELQPLSTSAVQRAMRGYGVHPDQLLAPEPVTPLISKHPNWCWQIDASLCVLYKLPDTDGYGIEEVKTVERYKNKLSHFAKIEHRLVQRYLVTDHASCAVFIYYAFGGESTESLCMLLVLAIQQREAYPFFGIPRIIMLDRGSANRSAMFRNLCKALGIRLEFAQRARAKGQVEKMHDVTELGLESGLKMATHIRSVEQLNQLGQRWMHWFNGTRIHSRHGKTRYAAWQLIKPDQLITTDLSTEQLLLLARETPKACAVTPFLTVNFKGAEYDVSKVPGVMVDAKLMVCRCGFQAGMAQAVLTDAEGHDVFFTLAEKPRDANWGWFTDGEMIGETHGRHADTPAQTVRKELERLAMAADTDSEAAAKRKAKAAPFGGLIDPYKEMNDYQAPAYFPNRGTAANLTPLTMESPPLNHAQMALWLQKRLKEDWDPAITAELQKRWPEGATETEMEQILADLKAGRSVDGRAKLKAV
jgi:transposase InsO family protein